MFASFSLRFENHAELDRSLSTPFLDPAPISMQRRASLRRNSISKKSGSRTDVRSSSSRTDVGSTTPSSPSRMKWKRLSSFLSEGTHSCEVVSVHEIAEEHRRHAPTGLLVLVYFLLGQVIGKMKGWSPIDAFYCTVVTFTTVGFGDFNFTTGGDEHFLGTFFISSGVVIFGYALAQEFTGFMQVEEDNVKFRARERELGQERMQFRGLRYAMRRFIRRWVSPEPHEQAGLALSIEEEATARLRVNLVLSLLQVCLIVLVGAYLTGWHEGWDWSTSLYWAVATASTVGYGDVVPTTEAGRFIAAWVIIFSVIAWTQTLGVIAGFKKLIDEVEARNVVLNQFGTTLTPEEFAMLTHGSEIRELELNSDDDSITREQFCLYMLVKLERVSREELSACQCAFDKLDLIHNGLLTKQDVVEHAKLRREAWGDCFVDMDQMGKTYSHERCTNCGHHVPCDMLFCRKCGKPRTAIHSRCPTCGSPLRDEDEECSVCHRPSPTAGRKCHACQNVLMPDANFCRKCGTKVRSKLAINLDECSPVEIPALHQSSY